MTEQAFTIAEVEETARLANGTSNRAHPVGAPVRTALAADKTIEVAIEGKTSQQTQRTLSSNLRNWAKQRGYKVRMRTSETNPAGVIVWREDAPPAAEATEAPAEAVAAPA